VISFQLESRRAKQKTRRTQKRSKQLSSRSFQLESTRTEQKTRREQKRTRQHLALSYQLSAQFVATTMGAKRDDPREQKTIKNESVKL
jgi:hypothetical protein